MIITIVDLQNIFNNLIENKITREEADEWAFKIYSELDSTSKYSFSPARNERLIIDALQYLWGIDSIDENGKYLYSIEQIKNDFEAKWKIKITPKLVNDMKEEIESAIIIEDGWVKCPNDNCSEVFEVNPNNIIASCPRCHKEILNPLYTIS